MAEYVIYRGSWRRGGDDQQFRLGSTCLYNAKNNLMCCLGQCAFETGVKLDALQGEGQPCDVAPDYYPMLIDAGLLYGDDLYGAQSKFSDQAIAINDDGNITDQQREEKLADLGELYGHSITFVDGVAPWFAQQGGTR